MKNGTYTVESIEEGTVKVLYRKDESIEELLSLHVFDFPVKVGDLISVQTDQEKVNLSYLAKETADVKLYVKSLKEELLKKSNEE